MNDIPSLKHVKVVRGNYYYRPYFAVKDRHLNPDCDKYGYGKTIRLGKVTDPDSVIIAAYTEALKQTQYEKEPDRLTLNWLSAQYQQSRFFIKREPETQRTYMQVAAAILNHQITVDDEPETVGNLSALDLTTVHIRQIMDSRFTYYVNNGYKGGSQCNQQLSYLSNLYKWGIQHTLELATLPKNPCHGVEGFEVTATTRHVSDDEYRIQYDLAAENPDNGLCILFELTLGLAARGVEARTLKVSDCKPEGIKVNRRKGSRNTLIKWSPRLRAAYAAAMERHKQHKVLPIDPNLVLTRKGEPLSKSGMFSAMSRLKKKMAERGLDHVYWTMHLLKHKAVTESKNKRIAGHKTEAMRNRYDHSLEHFESGI